MEKWNELCYTLSENISSNLSEELFEQKVIQALDVVLGWKGFKGDLSVRSSVQVGAAKRLTPDIVVKSENKDLFVIEVKKPGIALNKEFESQLKSYMRQLKLDFGILIGQKIQIYYDGTLDGNLGFTLIDEIDFKRDSEKGIKFIELFQKENYSQQRLEQHTQIKLQKLNELQTIEKLKQELQSHSYIRKIEEILKIELLKDYDESIVEKVFEKISVKILDNSVIHNEHKEEIQPPIKTKKSQLLPQIHSSVKLYTLSNPVDLSFTKIKQGYVGNESANNWNDLLRLIVKILLNKGIPFQEIINKASLNIMQGSFNKNGFNQIPNTAYSLQNVPAINAGRAITLLSAEYKINVEIDFFWRDKPNAAFPNEHCRIINKSV